MYKCAIITPVGPGHETLYEECLASVKNSYEKEKGRFSEVIYIKVDDTDGKLGRSKARNKGIKQAADQGAEWLFFLDADDLMAPSAFEYVSNYIDKYDAVWGSIWCIEAGQQKAAERPGQLTFLWSIEDVLSFDPFVSLQMGHFVKTSAALSTLFNETLDTGEDFDYYLRVWEKHKCIKIPLPFFYNRRGIHSQGPRSATGVQWRQVVEGIIEGYRGRYFHHKVFSNADSVRKESNTGKDIERQMQVSIIIPVHNTFGAWLEECFRSILAQTYTDYEVIFVDDKSTNAETINILESFKDKFSFYRLITLQENKGVPFAINKGIEESKNEIIIRMDSDDIMMPERIEKQVTYLNKYPEVDILGAQIQQFDQNVSGEIRLLGDPTGHPGVITREYAKEQPTNWILNHPAVAFRKSRIQSIGGYDSSLVHVAEDAELWYRALRHNFIIHNLPDVLLMYRIHQNQNRHTFRGKKNSIFLAELRDVL